MCLIVRLWSSEWIPVWAARGTAMKSAEGPEEKFNWCEYRETCKYNKGEREGHEKWLNAK